MHHSSKDDAHPALSHRAPLKMESTDEFITFEARLASFKIVQKKRASTTGSRGTKTIKWPHPHISSELLAKAGWIYQPHPEHPDQVVCFLCRKGLDGWEKGDDPLLEHLNHAPNCGWAILAAIEAEIPQYLAEDPKSKRMIDARKATFAGRWPHEGKKGWKCKTKQLAEAGWKYTPTPESDDMATCAYCQLMLDGWEPGDKPLDEHFNRSPECLFFNFVDPNPAPAKKPARGRTTRASKASRASVQSTGMSTFISDGPSTLDMPAQYEDSIVTTASKRGRPKKATTAAKGGRKTRTKKEEFVEVEDTEVTISEDMPPPPVPAPKGRKSRKPANELAEDSAMAIDEDELVAAPKPKRGKKRTSEAVEDSVLTATEAPAPKRRVTRTQAAVNDAATSQQDTEMMEAEAPSKKTTAGRKKGRASAKSTRKASGTSLRSTASTASLRAAAAAQDDIPDDDEIERQLVADLERPLSDEEDMAMDSDSERRRKADRMASKKKSVEPYKEEFRVGEQGNYAMFDPAPVVPDEAEVNAELERMEAEAQHQEPELEKLEVPKKGRKAGTRKASRQTKKAKAVPEPEPTPEPVSEPEPAPEPEPAVEPEPEPEPEFMAVPEPEPEPEPEAEAAETSIYEDAAEPAEPEIHEPSPVSTSVATKSAVFDVAAEEEKQPAPAKRGRGRPPKKRGSRGRSSAASVKQRSSVAEPLPAPLAEPEQSVYRSVETEQQEFAEAFPAKPVQEREEELVDSEPELVVVPAEDEDPMSPVARPLPQIPTSVARLSHHAPSTPGSHVSPAVSTRNGVLSPSQSPQSSDAENHPPSSKPSKIKRPVLAPVLGTKGTPNRILNSPTKRTMVSTLQSTTPWTTVDIDLVLGSPEKKAASGDKENSVDRLLKKGSELTSPEKKMTVEEWIYHNAGKAEDELKAKCESMVGRFEGEGMRAMRVLEGLIVE
ncbi:hypothetical protein jhhlp_005979 [Lomentospora prolificans]|uniref:BIR-domain-containing protein n=1 Tax=Lomentospora prolificans TaxID=41688 RepID=A0A2N3N4L7_9PEZI|nr:hypothetical protein jhhlp_005979 [Lomentospora prolificans]